MATTGDTQDKVLLLGTYQSVVAATRLLGEAGYTIVAGLSEGLPTFVEHSRHARETWTHPAAAHGAEAFATALSGFLADRPDITTVLPMGDLEISALVDHAPTLPPTTVLAMQPAEAVRTCENKIALMRLADSLDIPQTPYALVDTAEALLAEAERIGFPCIAKAPNSAIQVLGKKAVICRDMESLKQRFVPWPDGISSLIVQRYVQGPRFNISAIITDGVIRGMTQNQALRTDRSDGTGVVVEGVSMPMDADLAEQCRRLSTALGLHGVALFQFMRDAESGGSHLLEINPRMGSNFPITVACGYNLPVLAVKIAHGLELSEADVPPTYPIGKRCVWVLGDLFGIHEDLKSGALSLGGVPRRLLAMFGGLLRADIHVSWSWRDPGPALAGLVSAVARALRRGR